MLCAAGVYLATREGDEERPERTVLAGRTERGQRLELVLHGGVVDSARTGAPVYCDEPGVWRTIAWSPLRGRFGAFHQEGTRFHVHQRADSRRSGDRTPETTVIDMRGRLAGDLGSARGTIEARWHWNGIVCRATVRFRAG